MTWQILWRICGLRANAGPAPLYSVHEHVGGETALAGSTSGLQGSLNRSWQRVEGNWNHFQDKLIHQWSRPTSDDLNRVTGQRDALVGKLQDRYGIAREAAERQMAEWICRRADRRGRESLGTKGFQVWFPQTKRTGK